MNFSNAIIRCFTETSYSGDNVLVRRRMIVLNLFSFAIFITASVMSALSFITGNFTTGTLNILIATVALYIFLFARKSSSPEKMMFSVSIVASILLAVLYYVSPFKEMVFIWTMVFPLLSVTLNGAKKGRSVSLLLFAVLLTITVVNNNLQTSEILPALRYFISYILIAFFASYMEATSEKENSMLLESRAKLEVAHRDLQEMTIRDSLTGLHNRRYLDDILPLVLSQSRRYSAEVALMMIDVDYFKKYNDQYGHQAGDDVLRIVGAALQKAVRRETDYVCRYGGEEFTIIMNKSSAEAVDACAQRIMQNLADVSVPHQHGVEGRITVSIGSSTSDSGVQDDTIETFIARADKALYEAKRMGRNRMCKL